MRGAISRLGYEGVVDWGKRAVAVLNGRPPTSSNIIAALRQIDAPFGTPEGAARAYGKSFADYRRDILEGERIALGSGASADRGPVRDITDLIGLLQTRHQIHSEQMRGEMDRHVYIEVEKPDQPVMIDCLGDMHLGSPATDIDLLYRRAELAKTGMPIYFGSVGDVLDAPIKPKLIEEAWLSALTPEEEIAVAADLLGKIDAEGRLLFVNAGNHDLFSKKMAGYSHLDAVMAKLSRVPYARYAMRLSVHVSSRGNKGEQVYTWKIRHKYRGGGLDPCGAGVRHVEKDWDDCEIYVAGHTHRSGEREIERHGKRRFVINLGSFKDSKINAYDIEHDFPHENLEPEKAVLLWPNRHKIVLSKTEDAIERMEQFSRLRPSRTPTRRARSGASSSGGSRSRTSRKSRSGARGSRTTSRRSV